MYLRKPMSKNDGKFYVQLAENRSPLSEILQEEEFNDRNEAWKFYHLKMKDLGFRY